MQPKTIKGAKARRNFSMIQKVWVLLRYFYWNMFVLTFYFGLKAARAKILGSSEIHVKRDSTIALACSVNIHASSVQW